MTGWSLSQLHTLGVGIEFLAAALTVTVLVLISAPYGRHVRDGWGPTVPNRLGWIVMESPAVLLFSWWFFQGPNAWNAVPLFLYGLWQLHYVHRTFIFPFRLRDAGKRMPLLVAVIAVVFNSLNAWVNATWIGTLGDYPDSWFLQPNLVGGALLFLTGFAINLWADTKLIRLRADGTPGYKIPRGGLYEWVTCPNYLGEILEWTGWAIAAWSWAGAAFVVYVLANLVPRALTNHRWYHEKFPDYPPERKALFPFVL